MAGSSQFLQKIAFDGRIGNLIIRTPSVPHAKAVMMLRYEHQVLHTCVLGHLNPGPRIEFRGLEPLKEGVVFLVWDRPISELSVGPFAGMPSPTYLSTCLRSWPPMKEKSE